MLGAIGGMTQLWKDMPETAQIALANIIDGHASAIVTRVAVLTASQGRPKVFVTLENISAGELCKATLSLPKEAAAALIPFTRQVLALHVVNAEYFQGEQAPARTQPDQQPLPIGEPTKTFRVAPVMVEETGPDMVLTTATAGEPMTVSPEVERMTKPTAPPSKPKPAAKGGRSKAADKAPPAKRMGSPFAG